MDKQSYKNLVGKIRWLKKEQRISDEASDTLTRWITDVYAEGRKRTLLAFIMIIVGVLMMLIITDIFVHLR